MDGVDRFVEQLSRLGFEVERRDQLAVVHLAGPSGGGAGEAVALGADPPNDYPSVPPHWLHLPAGLSLPEGNPRSSELGSEFRKWSRPHPSWVGDERSGQRWLAHARSLLAEAA